MDKIRELSEQCNEMQRKLIKKMIHSAVDYVRAVIVMETAASNIEGLDAEEAKENRESTDRARSMAHDAFISSVDVVNRICDKHGLPHIYNGGEHRRDYGDFALRLVDEIFIKRQQKLRVSVEDTEDD